MAAALVLGLCAALALWTFQVGREFAGVPVHSAEEVQALREELSRLKEEHQRALSVANSADSLLKAERTAQESLAARVRALEAENLALTRDVAFAEKMGGGSRAGGGGPVALRGLTAELEAVGRVRFQALAVLQQSRLKEFKGRAEVTLSGTHGGRPWTQAGPAPISLDLKPYQRLEGAVDFPPKAVLKQLDVRITDGSGKQVAMELVRL